VPRPEPPRPHRLLTRRAGITLTCALVGAVVAAWPGASGAEVPAFDIGPFRSPIAAGAAVDPNSAPMVARMTRTNSLTANLVDFGVPIYRASADTPRHAVTCTIADWGPCPFAGQQVPIPLGARASPGSDGAMVVVDDATGRVYEFWQARFSAGSWTTSWGAINDLAGTGWGGNSTGSGASRLAGVIRISEIAAGDIPHALAIQTDTTCAGVFRVPATKTDGFSFAPDCIPEGARVRLDPAVNLDRLDLTPAVRALGRALQTYGAYIVDSGGAPMSVSFEMDPTAGGNSVGEVYQRAGLRWDYDNLAGLPYDRLQVLA
jgi:hypothetical protein